MDSTNMDSEFIQIAYKKGYDAALRGKGPDENPYINNCDALSHRKQIKLEAWLMGFQRALKDMAM